MQTINLTLRADDAEPILRKAADDAAKFGAWYDYINMRTWSAPGHLPARDMRPIWQAKFLTAKRIVESFGVEYSPTSEEETIMVWIPHGKTKPEPTYISGVHAEACRAAADRVVRAWRASIS